MNRILLCDDVMTNGVNDGDSQLFLRLSEVTRTSVTSLRICTRSPLCSESSKYPHTSNLASHHSETAVPHIGIREAEASCLLKNAQDSSWAAGESILNSDTGAGTG
jgi:hypothetical protein